MSFGAQHVDGWLFSLFDLVFLKRKMISDGAQHVDGYLLLLDFYLV